MIEPTTKFGDLKPVHEQLPHKFKKGSELRDFFGECRHCKRPIRDDLFRGQLSPETDRMVHLEAVGYCDYCCKLSRFDYRIYDDLSIVGRDREGRWARWEPAPEIGPLEGDFQLIPPMIGAAVFLLLMLFFG